MTIPLDLPTRYSRFRNENFTKEAQRYRALAHTQNPRTMVIGCADSRVDPAIIFSAVPLGNCLSCATLLHPIMAWRQSLLRRHTTGQAIALRTRGSKT